MTNVNGPLPTSSQQEGGTQTGTASENDEESSLFITRLPRATLLTLTSCASLNAYNQAVSEE